MCLGLANGYIEPQKRSGSVSLIDGHIDPDTSEMTPQEALSIVEGYERALKEDQEFLNNGDEFHIEALKVCDVVKQALEKQIVKKPRTQFDRIKGMNVEKLAKLLIYANDGDFIVDVCDERNCKECDDKNNTCSGNCIQAVIKWLESEVEEK